MDVEEVKLRIAQIPLEEHNRMVNYLRRELYSRDLAEECVQEAYLQAMLHASQIKQPERLNSWMMTVAIRAARGQVQDYGRALAAYAQRHSLMRFDQNDPSIRLILADTLTRALKSFPAYYTEIFVLRYMHGWSLEKIGERLHVQHATVRQAHSRMKRILKQELKDLWNSLV